MKTRKTDFALCVTPPIGYKTRRGGVGAADVYLGIRAGRNRNAANEAASFYPPLAGDPALAHRVLFGAHHVYASIDGMMTWQPQSAQDLIGGCADANCALSDIEFALSNHTKAYAISKEAPRMPPIPFKVLY